MAPAKTKPAKETAPEKYKNFQVGNSSDTLELSKEVAKFIAENRLFQDIQGKQFVNVEGWQYAGARLGLVPITAEPERLDRGDEIAYKCFVRIEEVATGKLVGSGSAVCSNKENKKKYYQEFAIVSMAQTRAIGKGYRNLLAWIIRAAGYEPTPAEEMDYNSAPEVKAVSAPAPAAKAVKADPKPAPAPAGTAEDLPVVKYASARQKEEITRLLNNAVITRQEKTKMLLNLDKLDEERAENTAAKIRKIIEERESQLNAAPEEPEIVIPTVATGVVKWFDDAADPENELARIANECDLAACENWLVNFRTKKVHRAKLEELYISIKSGKCKKAAADPRPTKTDAEFKEILAELSVRKDLGAVKKEMLNFYMRPNVFKAFKDLETHLEPLFDEIPDKPAKAKKPAKADGKTEPVVIPEELSDPGGYATAKQKEEIIRLINGAGLNQRQKADILLGINKLTIETADDRIAELKKLAEKFNDKK